MAGLRDSVKRELKRYDGLVPHLKTASDGIRTLITERLREKWRDDGRPTPPVVYCRVKPRSSIQARIEERYSRLEDFPDLIGCRVVVLHSIEIDNADNSLRGLLDLGSATDISFYGQNGRATGYSGCYWERLPISSLHEAFKVDVPLSAAINQCKWELQIHTAMQEAWSRLSHERFYKSRVGVPHRTSQLLRRLAAVTDLVDEQFIYVERHLVEESERVRALVRSRSGYEKVEVDEYVLLLAEGTWDRLFKGLRDLGRSAGFRQSEWEKLVRIGDETDLCVSVCERTGIRSLGEFLETTREMLQSQMAAETVAKLAAVVGATQYEPTDSSSKRPFFDRPLFVFSYARLLQFPEYIDAVEPLRANIKAALKAIALS